MTGAASPPLPAGTGEGGPQVLTHPAVSTRRRVTLAGACQRGRKPVLMYIDIDVDRFYSQFPYGNHI